MIVIHCDGLYVWFFPILYDIFFEHLFFADVLPKFSYLSVKLHFSNKLAFFFIWIMSFRFLFSLGLSWRSTTLFLCIVWTRWEEYSWKYCSRGCGHAFQWFVNIWRSIFVKISMLSNATSSELHIFGSVHLLKLSYLCWNSFLSSNLISASRWNYICRHSWCPLWREAEDPA